MEVRHLKILPLWYLFLIPNAVKIQNRAFYNGKKIKELNLDHVKEIETEAFYQCNALTALNVPKVLKIGEKAILRL